MPKPYKNYFINPEMVRSNDSGTIELPESVFLRIASSTYFSDQLNYEFRSLIDENPDKQFDVVQDPLTGDVTVYWGPLTLEKPKYVVDNDDSYETFLSQERDR